MKNTFLFKSVVLIGALVSSGVTFADQGVIAECKKLTLVTNVIAGWDPILETSTPTTNETVCVDVPAQAPGSHVVFNLDTNATTNGTNSGNPVGLRHMWMLGRAQQYKKQLNPGWDATTFQIIGIMHGEAATWALSNQWWIDHVPGATGNPYAKWLDNLMAINNGSDGPAIPIQLEICGVTMSGKGWTNADLYPGIHVNQGAIGRLLNLEAQGYAYIQPGYVDNDSMYATIAQLNVLKNSIKDSSFNK